MMNLFGIILYDVMIGDISTMQMKKALHDPSKSYLEKVETLLLGWMTACKHLSRSSPRSCENILKYLNKNTLLYLLHGDWTQLEDGLRAKFTVILHKLMALSKTDQDALKRFKLLIKLIHEPWQNSTLHKILHSLSPTDNEVNEYISGEGSELLLMRLEVLCEGKCEDLALNLASSIVRHLSEQNDFKKEDVDYINDAFIVLLFRFKRNQEIIEKLKNMDLTNGLKLIKRLNERKSNETGLWKFCDKVTELAAHTVLASVIVQNLDYKERQELFYDLVNEWALINVPKLGKCLASLSNMVRKIIQKAISPIHVYIFAQVLYKQLGDEAKPLCIELYIRGFTSNINMIENFKSVNDNEKVLKAEILLSNSFLELSDLLEDNIIIHRECILTSFSLNPTQECLKKLENAASLRCKNCKNQDILDNSELEKLNAWNDCDNLGCIHAREKMEDNFIEAVNSLNILNSDLLGLAPHLCDDLSTVLCNPRCQTLSWSLGWSHLKKQCEKYLDEHGERKTRNTELKYLNIDYSQFETECNKNNQKRIKKPKCKSAKLNTNIYSEKKNPDKNDLHCHKNNVDKNVWSSTSKMNSLLCKSGSLFPDTVIINDDSSNEEKEVSSVQLYSGEESKSYNVKCSGSFQSKEGSVLSCTNSSYENAFVQSPRPAEVPPVSLAVPTQYERLVQSTTSGNTKPLVTDISSKNIKRNTILEYRGKNDIGERFRRANILSKRPIKHDKILAKSIPGMNSLDLIVPLRPEPTIQVVQIPNSHAVLQPMSSESASSMQNDNTNISVSKPLTESISTQATEIVTTHSQSTQVVERSRDDVSNSNLLLTTVVNQAGLSRIHGTDQRNMPLLASSIPISATQTQTKATDTNSTETMTVALEQVGGSIGNVTTQEGSTQVTAHIQRVGQPHKQKVIFDDGSSLKSNSTQNSNIQLPGTIQVFEDPNKPQSTATGSIYRFILKDGKILEQYCHASQNSTFSMPEVLESNIPTVCQQDNVIKVFKKKRDEGNNSTSESVQVPSLPQFHQAFRRQVYQSGSIIGGNLSGSSSAPRQYPEESTSNSKQDSNQSPLSKAVQTVLKDAETSTKSTDKSSDEPRPLSSSTSTSTSKEDMSAAEIQSPSGVIFTCKVPITLSGSSVLQAKPVTLLKSNSSPEVLCKNPKKPDSDNRSKDSVIRSNFNALLAAALQSSPVKTNVTEASNTSNIVHCMKQVKTVQEQKNEDPGASKLKMPTPQKNIRRPTLIQPPNVSRFSRPVAHSSSTSTSQIVPPVVTVPLQSRTVHVLSASVNQNPINNMTSKVDSRRDQLSQNTGQSSVSSTTLEQLREFESVLEQVTNTSQMKERDNAKKPETTGPTTSSTSNSEFSSSSSSKVNTLLQTSLVNAISDLTSDTRVSLTFISKAATTCTNTIISGASPKITAPTPVVVVQSCNRPLASPALSISSQNSPGSSPTTPPSNSQSKISPKLAKPKAKAIGGKSTPTTTLKVSALPKPQQKPQEDEQTTQRIYAILDKYAEQLRNSPELKNKPAPRRRSNPPTNPSQSSKRKKSSQNKSKSFSNMPSCSGMEMSPSSEDLRTGGSEDSSNGISQVTQTVNSPHSRSEEHSNQGDTSSDVSETLEKDQRLQHRILLADQSNGSGRTVIVQDNVQSVISVEGTKVIAGKQLVVGGNATVPLTLQLPATGNVKQVLFPVSTDGRPFVVAKVPKMYRFHQVTMPSGSPLIATNSSGTVLLRQMCLNKSSSTVKQVKLPVVSQISTTHVASHPTVVLPSPPSFTLSTGSSIDSESLGIALDNSTILLNSSNAHSSIGFIQRNVPKGNQSPTVLTQTRQVNSQETNTNSPEPIPSMKSESIIKSEDTSVSSDLCENELKTEEDGVKYSLESNLPNESSSKVPTLINSSTNNNWVQVLKDNPPGSSILNKTLQEEESPSHNKETLNKGLEAGEVGKEIEIDHSRCPTPSSQQAQGLKRKVENTIFQIAFKRDKLKLTKDDVIHQRTSNALEKELRLQKSLSEECEDLGVDKPSTSDLFPEAELLLDPDPLSRDSLQGEPFPRPESSSSSTSPNSSPLVFSNKPSSNNWKKNKRPLIRHKVNYAKSSSPKKSLLEKTDPRESPFNVNLCSSRTAQFDTKDNDANFKISKSSETLNMNELQEIGMDCNDSDPCNFSDVDDNNDTDLLDTECESDSDFMKARRMKSTKKEESDKLGESYLLRRLSNEFNNDTSIKRHDDGWFQVIKSSDQKEFVDSETDKSNLDSREDLNESQNGDLEDFDENLESSNNISSNKISPAPKRKKVGLFITSGSEDSGSSMETLLTCSGDYHHESRQQRASPRGRVKKDCPCFNGSPDPLKKKKEFSLVEKTDKPSSTKSTFTFTNKKSVSKSNVKLLNRKR